MFWFLLFFTISLEIIEDTLFYDSIHEGHNFYLILSLILHPINIYLFYLLLFYKKSVIVVGLWSIISLILVTIYYFLYKKNKSKYKTKYKTNEIVGVIIGLIGSFLLYV